EVLVREKVEVPGHPPWCKHSDEPANEVQKLLGFTNYNKSAIIARHRYRRIFQLHRSPKVLGVKSRDDSRLPMPFEIVTSFAIAMKYCCRSRCSLPIRIFSTIVRQLHHDCYRLTS